MENSPSALGLIVIRQGILAEEFRASEASRNGALILIKKKFESRKRKNGETRISSTSTMFFAIYFGKKESLAFFSLSFFLDINISSYGYIHRDIYVIASSTHAISSDGKNNVFRSSSGLYLTFLPGYMTLFLLIMRAAQHVSSFIYHFQYHFPSALLACCSTIPRPFSLFRNFSSFFFCTFTGQLVPPFIISINDLRVYLSPLEPMNRRFALGTQMQIENNTGLKFIGESVIPSKEREFNKLRLNARERHGREKVRKQGNVRSRRNRASILYLALFYFAWFIHRRNILEIFRISCVEE